MAKTYLNLDKDLQILREDFESGKIKQEDMSMEQALLLNFVYELEMINLDEEIEDEKEILNGYKTRLKEAIKYLKSKNENNSSYKL